MGNTYMHVTPNRHHGYNRTPLIPHNNNTCDCDIDIAAMSMLLLSRTRMNRIMIFNFPV